MNESCASAAMAIAVAVTTNRGAGKDDWVPWQLPEAFRGRNVLALQPLILDLFTSKANISPTALASNLTKIVNVDGTKPFERGAKNAGIHLYEYSEKGEDEGVDGIMYARIAPASTNLEEKAPAPFVGTRFQPNLDLQQPAVNKALDKDIYDLIQDCLAKKYRGGEEQHKLMVW